MSEKDMSAFQPVLAVYRGKTDGEKVMGTLMIVGLSRGNTTEAMVLNDKGQAVRIGAYMSRKCIGDWSIELNPFVVNQYLKDLERETEEKMFPLLHTQTLQDEEVGSWDDET